MKFGGGGAIRRPFFSVRSWPDGAFLDDHIERDGQPLAFCEGDSAVEHVAGEEDQRARLRLDSQQWQETKTKAGRRRSELEPSFLGFAPERKAQVTSR